MDSIPVEKHRDLPLPLAFLEFLDENGIDPSIYSLGDSVPRYIRIKPGCELLVREIEGELNCEFRKVDWIPGFFSIPPHVRIASSNAYRQGKIYGIDAASGAAVLALGVSPGDHVLDLCAAPGAKLCMLSDILSKSGSLTGVDVSRQRLAACRTLLQKYAIGDYCRLFVADGTTFSLFPVRSNINEISCKEDETSGVRDITDVLPEWSSKRPCIERRRLKKIKDISTGASEPELIFYGRHSGMVGLPKAEVFEVRSDDRVLDAGYDKVLVDAECTHDGSIKHIQKFEYWGWETLQQRVLDAQRTDSLMFLQLQLLSNGFRLLKVGGSLVYSTCSLTVKQNESIVEHFLSGNPNAELQEVDAAKFWPCRSGRISKTLRFDPSTSQTSGLFVAKIVKLPS